MIDRSFDPRQAYRMLRIIFYSLNTGLLIFFIAGIYLNDMQVPQFTNSVDILTIANLLLAASIPVGYMISGRKMASINPKEPFSTKFEQFQSAMIIRWAMIEGTAIFSIVGMIVLNDAKQLVIFLLCIVVLSANAVTKDRVIRMAKLNKEEARMLLD